MQLLDYTTPRGFVPRMKCGSVEEAVSDLVATLRPAAERPRGDDAAVNLVRDVMRREAEGSTAIGGGLVIPHARSGNASEPRLAVATLAAPLDIPSEDGRPVDIVILLVGPQGDPRQMLRILARLARLVKLGGFLDGLRAATTPEDLRAAFALSSAPSD